MADIKKFKQRARTVIADGLQNVLTGLGIEGIDKSASSQWAASGMDYAELEAAFAGDWLSNKVVSVPAFDMTRNWRTFTGTMDPEKRQIFLEAEKKLGVRAKFESATKWGRLYGGCGLVILTKSPLDEPLDVEDIGQDDVEGLVVVDRRYLSLDRVNHDPLDENFGYPDFYRIAASSTRLHHTHVLRFEGVPLPLQSRRENSYWGKSVLEVLQGALKRAAEAQESIGALLHEATVDVISIPDLAEKVSDPDTELALQKRFAVAKTQKSINRMLLLDAEEEYTTHQQTFAGLTNIIEKYLDICAGAADIPITRLLGQSPGGMNSTGESDIRNYYDFINAKQERDFRPLLEKLDRILYQSLFGQPPEDGELEFEFNSLWQMDEAQQATVEQARAARDAQYLADGIVTEDIVARDLMERGVYSGLDADYVEAMQKFISEIPDVGSR